MFPSTPPEFRYAFISVEVDGWDYKVIIGSPFVSFWALLFDVMTFSVCFSLLDWPEERKQQRDGHFNRRDGGKHPHAAAPRATGAPHHGQQRRQHRGREHAHRPHGAYLLPGEPDRRCFVGPHD